MPDRSGGGRVDDSFRADSVRSHARSIMLENCRWLLYTTRFYGSHPHTIRERAPITGARFRALALYSLLACAGYCVVMYYSARKFDCRPVKAMIVGCALLRVHRYTQCTYMITATLLSCARHSTFERALAVARRFDDDLTRRCRRRADDAATAARKSLIGSVRAQWWIVLAIHVICLVFSAMFLYMDGINAMIMITSVTRIAYATEIAKFYFLYDALRRRFHRLNGLCHEQSGAIVGVNIGVVLSKMHVEPLAISQLYRLYQCLSDATNHLSSYYSLQLFGWIACQLMDILTYIFFVIFQGLKGVSLLLTWLLILFWSIQIMAICHICHLTCDEANALASTMLSEEAAALKRIELSTEAIELGVYLRAHPLRIKVLGLFNLDNQFTISVFGFIFTYVILASSLF